MVGESRSALQGVRHALIELYAAVSADPQSPQEVARRFGINRNLTWKLSRVITAKDPFSALNHLPGQQGLDLALDAFTKQGAPNAAIESVHEAIKRFAHVVDTHAGDRDQFELTLESMGLFEREYRMETGRELAFRGNSMIWGVQARTRLCTVVMAPETATTTSVAYWGGVVDFRRLRPSARWRLFRSRISDDEGRKIENANIEEIETKQPGDPPMFIREFSSPNVPEIETCDSPEGCEFVLPGGPVGKLGAFDCYYGYVLRDLPTYRTERDHFGSFAVAVTMPTETLLFDLVLHRDCKLDATPEFLVYGFPHGGADHPAWQTQQNLLPISADILELAGPPPAVVTPLVPKYNHMMSRIYARMGWNPQEFRGFRFRLAYPPMSSLAVVRWPLPERETLA